MSCAMSTSELIVDYEHFTMRRALIMKLIVQPVHSWGTTGRAYSITRALPPTASVSCIVDNADDPVSSTSN